MTNPLIWLTKGHPIFNFGIPKSTNIDPYLSRLQFMDQALEKMFNRKDPWVEARNIDEVFYPIGMPVEGNLDSTLIAIIDEHEESNLAMNHFLENGLVHARTNIAGVAVAYRISYKGILKAASGGFTQEHLNEKRFRSNQQRAFFWQPIITSAIALISLLSILINILITLLNKKL